MNNQQNDCELNLITVFCRNVDVVIKIEPFKLILVSNLLDILDILKQHHDRCQTRSGDGHDSYMAIVHVRDMLIPVKQRLLNR